MNTLKKVCGVLNLDGFLLKPRKFYTREIGFVSLEKGTTTGTVWRFKLPQKVYDQCSSKERWHIRNLTDKIHGLPFFPEEGEVVCPLDQLEHYVLDCYRTAKTDDQPIMAYKGGHYEKDLLKKLNIPCLNLETYGCPKVEEIIPTVSETPFTCSLHENRGSNIMCTMTKAFYYKKWLDNRISSLESEESYERNSDEDPYETSYYEDTYDPSYDNETYEPNDDGKSYEPSDDGEADNQSQYEIFEEPSNNYKELRLLDPIELSAEKKTNNFSTNTSEFPPKNIFVSYGNDTFRYSLDQATE